MFACLPVEKGLGRELYVILTLNYVPNSTESMYIYATCLQK